MQIARDTFFAALGEKSIVLDLRRDRYIGLGPTLTKQILEYIDRRRKSSLDPSRSRELLANLVKWGVLSENSFEPDFIRAEEPLSVQESSLWPTRKYGIGFRIPLLAVSALRSLNAANRSLDSREFVHTIAWLRATKASLQRRHRTHERQDLLDAFYAAHPWFHVAPICRLDAPALCLFLWKHGHEAELVFGVRLAPFQAHCWVQAGSVAFGEAADRLRQFTPIMRI